MHHASSWHHPLDPPDLPLDPPESEVERVLVRVMPDHHRCRDLHAISTSCGPPLSERAARIVASLQICAVDDRRRVVPMGASRARHVRGSRRRQGSTCFRSNDGSYSVRAVFGLPPRSDRGSRRADAVAIPTALSSCEDLTVIAPFRFKEYRRMRRQQGGIGRPPVWPGREPRGETKRRSLAGHHPGSALIVEVLPSLGRELLHGSPAEPSSHRTIPSRTRSNPEPRICTTSSATPRRTRSPRTPGCSPAARTVRSPGDTAASWAPALLRKHGRSHPASHPERLSSPRRGRPMKLVVRSD
jgi:hypothetical protein